MKKLYKKFSEKILHAAQDAADLSNENDKQKVITNLIQYFGEMASDENVASHGAIQITSCEASDAYIIQNKLQELTKILSPTEIINSIIKDAFRYDGLLFPKHIFLHPVPDKYLIAPFDYVDKRFGFYDKIIGSGSITLVAPSLDSGHFCSCQIISGANNEYQGMNIKTVIVNYEYPDNPFNQAFICIAHAILEYVKQYPELMAETEALYHKSYEDDDTLDDSWCIYAMVQGLACGSIYSSYVEKIPYFKWPDDSIPPLWRTQIEKILDK